MISFNKVTFTYEAGGTLLENLSLEISRGERVCLIGLNGSGKTTLLKLMAGLLLPTQGEVLIDDIPTADSKRLREIRGKIGFIFQNPEDQIIATSVGADIAFTLENLAMEQSTMQRKVSESAARFDLDKLLSRHPGTLSAGEKQRTALASVMVVKPQILLLDEPTSFLDYRGRQQLFEVVFADSAVTVVAATQYPNEVARYDRVIFLNNRQIAFDGPRDDFYQTELWRMVNGMHAGEVPSPTGTGPSPASKAQHAITVHDLSFGYSRSANVIDAIDLTIPVKEITAVMGDSGCGKTTLALLLAGLIKPGAGEIQFASPDIGFSDVSVLFQFPESSFFADTVFEEVAFGVKDLHLSKSELTRRVCQALDLVRIPHESFASRNPFTLSSGERRRVAIAAVLIMNRPVIIFDETTLGLDWEGRRAMVELLHDLKESTKTIIVMTHDYEFVAQTAEYFVFLEKGKVVWQGSKLAADLPVDYMADHLGVAQPPPGESHDESKALKGDS